jgi:hypothetical protein
LIFFYYIFFKTDGMSTITFLPYIGDNFIKEYIIPNYIGESLSSLVPGVLGMIQRVGENKENCSSFNNTLNASNHHLNATTNNISPVSNEPRFSVSLYFFLMFILISSSALSFTIINFWKAIKVHRKVSVVVVPEVKNQKVSKQSPKQLSNEISNEKDNSLLLTQNQEKKKLEIGFLFFLTFLVSFMYYGYLPGILSYSAIPYGVKFFHLSINLSNYYYFY